MADLRLNYNSSTDQTIFLFEQATFLSGKVQLKKSDLIDYGLDLDNVSLQFTLKLELFARITYVAINLQELLNEAADLVPGRISYYLVDPEEALLPAL